MSEQEGKKKILLVDDDLHIQRIVSFKLLRRGFDVTSVMNGVEALRSVEESKPDLILLDIMMPEMDGYEFNRILKSREELKNIPVFVLTAKGQVVDRNLAYSIGVTDYITKPFSPREMLEKVLEFLGEPEE